MPDIKYSEDEMNNVMMFSQMLDIIGRKAEVKEFIGAMENVHRTIQQKLMRDFIEWLKFLASLKPGEYDLRNEDCVTFAKEVVKHFEEEYPELPFNVRYI